MTRLSTLPLPPALSSALLPAMALASALTLAACTAPGDFPSLAVRESERVSGTMLPPQGSGFTSTPVSPATIEQLDSLAATAREAHGLFLGAVDQARGPVEASRGADIGSEEWSVANVALAGLQSIRSDAMIALADIDRLYVTAVVDGGEFERIAEARNEVQLLVVEQDRVIADLARMIGS